MIEVIDGHEPGKYRVRRIVNGCGKYTAADMDGATALRIAKAWYQVFRMPVYAPIELLSV